MHPGGWLRWPARVLGWLMGRYVRLVAATSRVRPAAAPDDQVVLAMWHEHNLAATVVAHRLRGHRRHVSFSTRTLRGEVMNAMLASLGHGAMPLPGEGERREATRVTLAMAGLGAQGASLVVSPDGPAGPYRVAKPGTLILARETGLPIQPWAVAVRPALRLTRRWDRQLVPLPFSRLTLVEGRRIEVPPRARLRPLLGELQAALDEASALADGR